MQTNVNIKIILKSYKMQNYSCFHTGETYSINVEAKTTLNFAYKIIIIHRVHQ